MLVMKPVKPSTAICQRPGTSSRFIPPSMNSHRATQRQRHPQRAVGEGDVLARDFPILRRTSAGPGTGASDRSCPISAATLLVLLNQRLTSSSAVRNLDDAPEPADGPEDHHDDQEHRPRSQQAVEQPADQRAAQQARRSGTTGRCLPSCSLASAGARLPGPDRFLALRPLEPLVRANRAAHLQEASGPARSRPPPWSVSPCARPALKSATA